MKRTDGELWWCDVSEGPFGDCAGVGEEGYRRAVGRAAVMHKTLLQPLPASSCGRFVRRDGGQVWDVLGTYLPSTNSDAEKIIQKGTTSATGQQIVRKDSGGGKVVAVNPLSSHSAPLPKITKRRSGDLAGSAKDLLHFAPLRQTLTVFPLPLVPNYSMYSVYGFASWWPRKQSGRVPIHAHHSIWRPVR